MHDLNVYHTLQMSAHTGIPVDISGTRNCKRFLSNSRVGHFCNAIVPRRKKKKSRKILLSRNNNICSAHKYHGFSVGRRGKQMIVGAEEVYHLHPTVLFLRIYY